MLSVLRATTAAASCLQQIRPACMHALTFSQHGEPADMLKLEEQQLPGKIAANEVLVEILASPVNPSDINVIQGRYPIKPKLPGIPGNEGVARVLKAGNEVQNLKEGSWAVPIGAALGFWRQQAVLRAGDLHEVPSSLGVEAAATLCINPPSAYRMLEEYEDLHEGDSVIQNGANSAVGQLVIQIAKARGLRTINIVRERPEQQMQELETHLKSLGADVVTTEAAVREAVGKANLPAPRLGLNCVGGSASTAVAKMLAPHGKMVTYGAMSLRPTEIPAGLQIFKGISAHGFWLSGGPGADNPTARRKVLDTLVPWLQDGTIKPPATAPVPLKDWQQAFQNKGIGSKKALFWMQG